MAHRNDRLGRTGGGIKHRGQLPAAKQAPAGERAARQPAPDGGRPVGRVAAPGRRPPCGAGGEPAAAQDDGGSRPRRAATRQLRIDRDAFDIMIVQQWTKTLQGPYDWGDWPLARYRLGVGVVSAAESYASASPRCAGSAVERLAWVCAMVACGRAPRLRSLDAGPLPAGAAEAARADGARGWRCNLQRDTRGGPQLHYWIHPSGLVEFEAVVERDLAPVLELAPVERGADAEDCLAPVEHLAPVERVVGGE
ncbi:MAG TPA: hypothetical protein VK756_08955 [Solirubrobacteraceae bacterium]|nr:hypothetical protein [Solirubrobacteraceae bacterium]